jgi:hypothetical protein
MSSPTSLSDDVYKSIHHSTHLKPEDGASSVPPHDCTASQPRSSQSFIQLREDLKMFVFVSTIRLQLIQYNYNLIFYLIVRYSGVSSVREIIKNYTNVRVVFHVTCRLRSPRCAAGVVVQPEEIVGPCNMTSYIVFFKHRIEVQIECQKMSHAVIYIHIFKFEVLDT